MNNDNSKNSKAKTKDASSVDAGIGEKINHLRLSKGITRNDLAAQIGVTHQQLQKYEKGINRITASRLVDIASALEVPIAYFFEDIMVAIDSKNLKRQRLYLEMMRDFVSIEHDDVQESIRKLIRVVCDKY